MGDFDLFLQYVANGVVVGSSYVLVAVGLTLIFGVLGVVNFAHGELYMLGGYAGVVTLSYLRLPFVPAVILSLLFVAALGAVIEFILHRPLKNRDSTSSIISSFGIAVVLQNGALLFFGPQPALLSSPLSSIPIELGPIFLPMQKAIVPLIMLMVVTFLYIFLNFSWAGRSLRAMAQHRDMARLCGVRVQKVAVITFITGAVLAGMAGLMMSTVYMVYPVVGSMIVLKAFTIVILGGMGNIPGAIVGGLLLGIAESLTSAYLTNGLRDIVGFVIVIAVLLLFPKGLFGKSVERS